MSEGGSEREVDIPGEQHEALYRSYVAELEARYRGFRVLPKADSRLCRAIDRILRVLTLGRQDRFMTEYVTTFGRAIFLPESWEDMPAGRRYCTLRHEAVHVRQFRRWTWPGITLVYLLLPLPTLFAGGRAWLEWEAYRETLTAHWQVFGSDDARSLKPWIVGRFTGPDYGWMWVRGTTIERAIDRHLARLEHDPPVKPSHGAS